MITIKINLELDPEDIKQALEERGIAVNQANTKRFLQMFSNTSLPMLKETYARIPRDHEQLLMHGFTFKNGGKDHE